MKHFFSSNEMSVMYCFF